MGDENSSLEAGAIPKVVEGMTPDQAKEVLDKIHDAASIDPSHPSTNAHHPQHAKMKRAVTALHEIWAKRDGASVTPTQRACEAALAAKTVKDEAAQAALRKSGQAEIDALAKLGFSPVELPSEVQPHHLATWRMQRAHAEGNYAALEPMMSQALQGLKVPADVVEMFGTFTAATGLDAELKSGISQQIIEWIHRANKQKYGRSR